MSDAATTSRSSDESSDGNSNNNNSSRTAESSSVAPKSHFKSQEDQDLIRLALHKSPFFTCLDEEQIERFVRTAHKESFAPGSIVILEGCVDEENNEDNNTDNIQQLVVDNDSLDTTHNSTTTTKEREPLNISNMDDGNGEESATDGGATENEMSTTTTALPQVLKDSSASSSDDPDVKIVESLGSENEDILDENVESPDDYVLKRIEEKKEPPSQPTTVRHNTSVHYVPAPRSGKVRSLYIIRRGKADVWYQQKNNNRPTNSSNSKRGNNQQQQQQPNYIQPHAMGPGTLFGEGGFLFGRQHSASIVAARTADEELECWVVDLPTFRDYVLLSENMKHIFQEFASVEDDDNGSSSRRSGGSSGNDDDDKTRFMTLDDFMQSCERDHMDNSDLLTGPFPVSSAAQTDPWARARVANTLELLRPSRGRSYRRISLEDFCWFYFFLARPDFEVDIAFLLMDQTQTGQVGLAQVASLVEPVFPGTNFESDFFRRYFGDDGQKSLRPSHFSQFFADLHHELGRQVFVKTAAPTNGYLEPAEFVAVLRAALGWRLPLSMADRLENLYGQNTLEGDQAASRVSMLPGSVQEDTTATTPDVTRLLAKAEMEQIEKGYGDRCFAYPDFLAFQEVISNLPGICNLIDRAQEIKQEPLSPDDFKVANRVLGMGGRLSRRQVDIIFDLFDLNKDGYISREDTVSVCGVDFARRLVAVEGRNGKLTFAPPRDYLPGASAEETTSRKPSARSQKIVNGLEYFGLAFFAAAVGTVALYPVDLVKTRLMNQRRDRNGARMYLGFFDCMQRALAREGVFGLYRGLTPQLLGLGPEKLIKLRVNDLLRQAFHSKDRETGKPGINLPLETLAGAVSGACQLLITNPMELTKIRMQIQGETSRILSERGWATTKHLSAYEIAKDLGFPGIYRGASACLLRDIFFGALYFPSYAWCKDQLASRNEIPGYATPFDLLTAGTVAGIPASFLTTPLDVIKTRLQTLPRPEEMVYVGIRECAMSIYKHEGLGGFFMGAGARVLRISPQFGISLFSYEMLFNAAGSHDRSITPAPPTNAFVEPYDYRTAFPVRSI